MSRIQLTDTAATAIAKMAEGNPGAVKAMIATMETHDKIDPQSVMGGLSAMFSLDTHKIYGTDIYVLFSDKCQKNVRKFLMILRAVQLGFFPETRLQEMAHDQARQIDLSAEEWADLDSKVCNQLDHFEKLPHAKEKGLDIT